MAPCVDTRPDLSRDTLVCPVAYEYGVASRVMCRIYELTVGGSIRNNLVFVFLLLFESSYFSNLVVWMQDPKHFRVTGVTGWS